MCIYVCIYVFMYVCMYVCMYVSNLSAIHTYLWCILIFIIYNIVMYISYLADQLYQEIFNS